MNYVLALGWPFEERAKEAELARRYFEALGKAPARAIDGLALQVQLVGQRGRQFVVLLARCASEGADSRQVLAALEEWLRLQVPDGKYQDWDFFGPSEADLMGIIGSHVIAARFAVPSAESPHSPKASAENPGDTGRGSEACGEFVKVMCGNELCRAELVVPKDQVARGRLRCRYCGMLLVLGPRGADTGVNGAGNALDRSAVRDALQKHVSRLQAQFGPSQGYSAMDACWRRVSSPAVMDYAAEAIAEEIPGALKEGRHCHQARDIGDLYVSASVVPTVDAAKAMSCFAEGYIAFLDTLLEKAAYSLRDIGIAHWVFCCDVAGHWVVHLSLIPARSCRGRGTTGVLAIDLLTPAERAKLHLDAPAPLQPEPMATKQQEHAEPVMSQQGQAHPAPLAGTLHQQAAGEMVGRLLQTLVKYSGSQLRLKAGSPPILIIDGIRRELKATAFSSQDVRSLILEMAPEDKRGEWERGAEIGFDYEALGLGLFGVEVHQGDMGVVVQRAAEPGKAQKEVEPTRQAAARTVLGRMTGKAKDALVYAQQAAERSSPSYVDTQHLLLGLAQEGTGIAALALRRVGLDVEKLRAAVARLSGPAPDVLRSGGPLPFSPRIKNVLLRAAEEAGALGHSYIGTEHLLLSLLREPESMAARVLEDLGIDWQSIFEATLSVAGVTSSGYREGWKRLEVPQRTPGPVARQEPQQRPQVPLGAGVPVQPAEPALERDHGRSPGQYAACGSIRWLCYAREEEAREAFRKLRDSDLGGPGLVELRRQPGAPSGWWLVLYGIVCGSTEEVTRVYGLPTKQEGDVWFAYEGTAKVKQNTDDSSVVAQFDVPDWASGLLKAAQDMGEGWFQCNPDVTCLQEARKRLVKLSEAQDAGARNQAEAALTELGISADVERRARDLIGKLMKDIARGVPASSMPSFMRAPDVEAAIALSALGEPAVAVLIEALLQTSYAHMALGHIGGQRAFAALCAELRAGNWQRREAAAKALGRYGRRPCDSFTGATIELHQPRGLFCGL